MSVEPESLRPVCTLDIIRGFALRRFAMYANALPAIGRVGPGFHHMCTYSGFGSLPLSTLARDQARERMLFNFSFYRRGGGVLKFIQYPSFRVPCTRPLSKRRYFLLCTLKMLGILVDTIISSSCNVYLLFRSFSGLLRQQIEKTRIKYQKIGAADV